MTDSSERLLDIITHNVKGYDLNPLAVLCARANYIIALGDLSVFQKKVDYIIGNPPWIDWQNLPENYRDSIQRYWYEYKVFDHRGQKAQLGSAHDDISVLMTYVIMNNFLKDHGKLAFVINQNLLQTSGGGEGFRKFQIKEKIPVSVESVNDFVDVEPFKNLGVNNKTATIVLKKMRAPGIRFFTRNGISENIHLLLIKWCGKLCPTVLLRLLFPKRTSV